MIPERIATLSCWRGEILVEPISGGITNRNFLVRDDSGAYVARLCDDLRHLGIDRRNERLCQHQAAQLGIAPAVEHHEEGVLVSRFVTGKTLASEDANDPNVITRLAATLRELHGARDRLVGELLYFSPFQTVRTYTATARKSGAELPASIDELLADAALLEKSLGPFTPALCHNDLLPANLIDDGEKLWLVDWEYAGIGHPLFDLAGVAGNCQLPPEREALLLQSYLGGTDARALYELRVLKTISLLREAFWAVVQTKASDLDFDYGQYANDNFAAYRAARAALDASTG